MQHLIENYRRQLQLTKTTFLRYLYSQVNWNSRLVGIVGARGVGKTTMMLQHIKKEMDVNRSLYVTAEDFYFASHTLVELADEFTKMGGEYLCIDEVHRYPDWSKELKLIYDYHPELKVVFSGSSILDIHMSCPEISRH